MRLGARGTVGVFIAGALVACSPAPATTDWLAEDAAPVTPLADANSQVPGPALMASGNDGGESGSGSGGPVSSAVGGDAGDAGSGAADSGGGDARGATSGTGTDGGGMDSAMAVRYATQIAPLLNTACTNACHGGCGNLTISYANIVNVASGQVPSLNYVTPNDPGRSYLFCKVAPQDQACTSAGTTIRGSRMPLGAPALPSATLNLIKTWIQQGAPP